MKSRIAANIRLAIEDSELTVAEIARRISGHESAVRRWRRGEVTPNQENLARLAAALDRDVTWFYTDQDKVPA